MGTSVTYPYLFYEFRACMVWPGGRELLVATVQEGLEHEEFILRLLKETTCSKFLETLDTWAADRDAGWSDKDLYQRQVLRMQSLQQQQESFFRSVDLRFRVRR